MTETKNNFRFAAKIAVGQRPAGGLYITQIHTGQRFLTEAAYEIWVECTEQVDGDDIDRDLCDRVVCRGYIHPRDWNQLLVEAIAEKM